MRHAAPPDPSASLPAAVAGKPGGKSRDLRLDLFRGLAMFVIFIAHVPENPWNAWIPARFGWSSGAELFVFCSGLASAHAFGQVFVRHGFRTGSLRIAHRIWQIYWAQVGLFLTVFSLALWMRATTGTDPVARLFLEDMVRDVATYLPAFLTLRFVPNFFDILPMYMVLLAMVPAVMALARLSPRLALGTLAALWLAVQATGVNLSARPDGAAMWFFNPFAWQAMFFLGFAFGMGWIAVPVLRRGPLFAVCAAFLIVSVPLTFWGALEAVPALAAAHAFLLPDPAPTHLPILRILHFLASAYVVLTWLAPYRDRIGRGLTRPIVTVGQQSLATFLASLALALFAGMVLDVVGRDALTVTLANLGGILAIWAVARLVRAVKAKPDRDGPPPGTRQTRPDSLSDTPIAVPRLAPVTPL